MALPVVPTPDGPRSSGAFIENPVLGVVQSFTPWVANLMEVAVVVVAPMALIWAASTAMLGLSPSRLRARHQPPDPELARQAQS